MSQFMDSLSEVGGTEGRRAPASLTGVPPTSPPPLAGPEGPSAATAGVSAGQAPPPIAPPAAPPQAASLPGHPAVGADRLDDGAPVSAEFSEPLPEDDNAPVRIPRLGTAVGKRSTKPPKPAAPVEEAATRLTPQQRLLILDAWQRSGLPAMDFGDLVGLSKHTLYAWKKRFDELGPGGLMNQPRLRGPSHLPEVTKRTILMLKQSHPEWGCQRISDMLVRGPGLPASAGAVAKVLQEAGYALEEQPTKPHPDEVPHSFERARPNQLWQTDLFTFILKRQNRRVYLVAFMDDHSRFIVSYGLHASQSAALVMEVLRAGIIACGTPQEILTDNGSQYVTWRGKSAFSRELEKRGIKHVVSSPRHPQTLGKVERFWGSLWRECLEASVFVDLADAQARIGHFIDYYNFQRPHQALEGLVPADRFFQAAPQVKRTLLDRVAANALELATTGLPKAPFYLTGRVGEKTFSVHAEGERVFMTREGQTRQEIDLVPPPEVSSPSASAMPLPVTSQGVVHSDFPLPEEPSIPGVAPLDQALGKIAAALENNPAAAPAEGGEA